MKNHNLTVINCSKKRSIELTGNLSLSLRIGERAWLNVYGQSLMTSVVIRILEVSLTGVIFETQNTIYHLNYTEIPIVSEVMCA